MLEKLANAARVGVICAIGFGLSACSTFKIKPKDYPDTVFHPGPVETLGETIAREQQGEDGCLVAGNLNRGGDCEKLREDILPPAPSPDPNS